MSEISPSDFTSVAELLRRAKEERAALAQLWQSLDAAQMTRRPGPQADWSVKDMIAHIVWWEGALCDLLPRIIAGEDISFDGTVEEANASAFAQARDMPLSTVLENFERSWARLEAALAPLSDAQVNDVACCQIFGKPLRHFIAANTFGNYADHLQDLKAYRSVIQS